MSEKESILDLFYRLAEVQAPSGFEEPMIRAYMKEIKPYVDEVHGTPRGIFVIAAYYFKCASSVSPLGLRIFGSLASGHF